MNENGEVCKFCGGRGTVSVDDMGGNECVCAYARRLKMHLGPEILSAENIRSPFFVPDGDDFTMNNVFFKSYWRDFLPHLKWVLGCKGPMFRFRILTDEKLRTVYVGSESYTSRPRSKRDDMDTNNSLNDIVGGDISLLIIRLGFLGYKNIAMPGILKEALMLREVALKPTWIVESPNAPLVPGHFAYSDEVFEYILERFKSVKVSDFDAAREDGVTTCCYTHESSHLLSYQRHNEQQSPQPIDNRGYSRKQVHHGPDDVSESGRRILSQID